MEKDLFLADDVEKIIVETDEENPTPVVTIDRSETPIKTDDKYRVRIQFKEKETAGNRCDADGVSIKTKIGETILDFHDGILTLGRAPRHS